MRIVFLGDSITDANHIFLNNGLGNGYVYQISEKLKKRGGDFCILNRGHDGATVQSLRRTLVSDCLIKKPDIVSILIGCNDVGIVMNTGKTLEKQEFAENYEKLLVEIKQETTAQILCAGPFIFPEPLEYINWFPVIDEVERIQVDVAKRQQVKYLPLQKKMQKYGEQYGYSAITTDGIHLTKRGSELLAEEWIKAAAQIIT